MKSVYYTLYRIKVCRNDAGGERNNLFNIGENVIEKMTICYTISTKKNAK